MITVGISSAHDSSVCVYEDGKISHFFKEERYSRKKRDMTPFFAINELAKTGISKVDAFAYCPVTDKENTILFYESLLKKFCNIKNVFNFTETHHLQHASLAFYNSGFDEAAVIIIDRNGSIFYNSARESETIFFATYPHNFKEIYKSFWIYDSSIHEKINDFRNRNPECEVDTKSMYGIVKVYESATTSIGQHPLENGKIMGLSAYGKKNKTFENLFYNNTNIPKDFLFSHVNNFGIYESSFNNLNDKRVTDLNLKNYQEYADFAYHVQRQTENAVLYLIEKAVDKTKCKNIVISGGYALNVVANNLYHKKFPNLKFYIEPIADDTGNSIGGAMLSYRFLSKDKNIYPRSNTFIHGKNYSLSNIKGERASYEDISSFLIDKKVVAVYNGLAEAGPRALGNRSILFNPTFEDAKDFVNKVKKREWYRPFAAMVLEEDAHKYFEMMGIEKSQYMTISFDVKEAYRKMFPGIVHVDNSCRIQTVDKSNKYMYELLINFKKNTGHGLLLNTSFNLAGEPLVETPDDAIKTLQNSEIDVLWFPSINTIVR